MPDGFKERTGASQAAPRLVRLLLALVLTTGCGTAASITFVTQLVTPGPPGAAVWENDYTISGFNFVQNRSLQLLFDAATYESLMNGVASPANDWDLLVLPPDPAIPAAGVYDMMALVDGPSFSGPFSVQYTLLSNAAGGPPTSQGFQVVQYDSDGLAGPPLESGTAASVAIPEPAAGWIAIAGLSALLARAARRRIASR